MHCIAALDARARRPLSVFENRRLEDRNFIYPWTDVVEYNADYRTAVQAEALRLGTEHPHFLSEYALQTPPSAGRLFSDTSLAQMANPHALPARPALVLAGAGALDDDGLSSGRSDSRFSPSFAFTTRTFLVDSNGANLAHSFSFTAVSKSALDYQLLAPPSSGRSTVEAAPQSRPRVAIGHRVRSP